MEKNNLSINTSAKNQQPPEQSINPIQKPNYWKRGFIVVLLMLGAICYYQYNSLKLWILSLQ